MNAGELFVQLGVKADTSVLKEFTQAINHLPINIAETIGAIAGLDYAFLSIAKQAFATAENFQMFTNTTGLNAQQLQKWQLVAERMNVSAGTVQSSITGLQNAMVRAKMGQGLAPGFNLLGISPFMDPVKAMEKLRTAVKRFRPEVSGMLLETMGVSREMLNVFAASDAQFKEFRKNAHGLTQEQEQDIINMQEGLTGLLQKWRDLIYFMVAGFAHDWKKNFVELTVVIGVLTAAWKGWLALLIPVNMAFLGIAAAISVMVGEFKQLYELTYGKNPFTGEATSSFGDIISSPGDTLKKLLENTIKAPFTMLPGMGAATSALGNATGNTFNVIVHGTADAESTAEIVMDRIRGWVRDSVQQHNNQGQR